ncbi:Ankyrin repeat domain-containing protein 42 [Sparganum proliferum]
MCDIFDAARKADIIRLKKLVNSGGLIDSADNYKRTALHHAVCTGAIESVQWLLWKGAYVNPVTLKGWTPLHLAAVGGNDKCAEALLSRQADPNIRDGNGNIPGHLAAIHGNRMTLNALLKSGTDIHAVNHRGWTMLHTAAFHGRLGCLKLLLQAGLSAEEQATDGNTSLHLAAKEGHLPAVQCLLNASVNWLSLLEARNDMGETALDLASELSKRTVVAYLEQVKWGRCLPVPDDCEKLDSDAHPGHVAVMRGDVSRLKRLLEEGIIKVNEIDSHGATLLHKGTSPLSEPVRCLMRE